LPHVVAPEVKILDDIRNNALRPVSYTSPTIVESDHPHQPALNEDSQAGPHWVNSIVSAVAASSAYRNNTAILVTWDDWGGWYDHYVPPSQFRYGFSANSYGFRTPLLVISPYVVKRVDHTPRSQASIIRFIESVFGLPSLGVLDAQTDDLSTMFNFSQSPNAYRQIGGSPATERFRGADVYPLYADPDE
jgi:phospholipase C